MKTTRNALLALLMLSGVNAQFMGGEQDTSLDPSEKQSTESTLEWVLLQLVSAQTRLHPDPTAFLESLPLKRQDAFSSLLRGLIAAKDQTPESTQQLEDILDSLGISEGPKYYFLYRFFSQIREEKAHQLADRFFEKSAETQFPRAVLEWVEDVINNKYCVQAAHKAVLLLKKLPNYQESKQIQFYLARLTLLHPEEAVAELTMAQALSFIFENQAYLMSLPHTGNDAFLQAGIHYLNLGTKGETIDKAIVLLSLFAQSEEADIASLVKLIYISQRLNLNKPEFTKLCRQKIYTMSLCDPFTHVGGSYLQKKGLSSPEILETINKSKDMNQDFLDLVLDQQEKEMKNKNLNLIDFFDLKEEKSQQRPLRFLLPR